MVKKIFFILLISFKFLSCKSEPNSEIIFTVKGMTCQEGCANTIQSKLNKTSGILNSKVDFNSETAKIYYDSTIIKPKTIISIIKKVGNYNIFKK